MKTYTARYTREGNAWVVQFGSPDISTFARTLDAAKRDARDLLAAYLGHESVEAAGVEVVDDVVAPAAVTRLVAQRHRLDEETKRLRQTTERVVRDLVAAGWSLRDVASVTGLSFQRVGQLAPGGRRARTRG